MKGALSILCTLLFLNACSFTKKIKDGETAYERKQYSIAADLLTDEFSKTDNSTVKARKAFLLGKSYLQLIDYDAALSWFQKSADFNYGPEAYFELGLCQKRLEEYESAIRSFEQYSRLSGNKSLADREIFICGEIIHWQQAESEYKIDRIFENSLVSDYSPVIYENDFLLFSSDRSSASGSDIYKWTGERFSDLFIMLKTGSEVRKFDSNINSDKNEGAACFSKNYEKLFFTRCFSLNNSDEKCKIMYSERDNGFYTNPEVLPFIEDKYNYGHPALIENDSVLIFSTDMGDPGKNFDLYYVVLDEDGTWSFPEPMPGTINSPGNEKFPTAHHDTLYFSSDYLPGLGGLDIFKTYLRKDGTWALPENMKPPVNSGGDDFGFVVDDFARLSGNIKQKGFFSSSRKGVGKDDIYIFTRRPVIPLKPDTEVVSDTNKVSSKRSIFLAGKLFEPSYTTPDDPNSEFVTNIPLSGVFIQILDENNIRIAEISTTSRSFFATEIQTEKEYKIIASKPGYFNAVKILNSKATPFNENELDYTYNLDIVLDKIYENKEINLKNIYYDFDKWEIRNEAKPALNELAEILKNNPQINIQLSSHTDCRGEKEYNQILSQKRAQSAVEYLISMGVDSKRLQAKGYGEDNLINLCECSSCTEDQHQENRRTTFKILK
ncbi:MAG: OmpA family protein [Saprospiraceae bacterium]|nr:OmpA family protein [Saprospiraceae bacterium]